MADAVERDLELAFRFFQTEERQARIAGLERPRPVPTAGLLALSWGLIVLAAAAAVRWPVVQALALVVIASRQRAIGNVLHDAAHGNAFARSPWVIHWLVAAPMFEELTRYRKTHLLHHAHLGDPARDPDLLLPPATEASLSSLRVYLRFLLNGRMWLANVLGALPQMDAPGRARVAAFWVAVSAALALALGPGTAAELLGLWLVARCTCYHAIKVLTELCDHFGLPTPGIFINTRNAPNNWLSALIHPHGDSYHLAHHLRPKVPVYNLPRLHGLLLDMPEYARADHCDGYVLGDKPVVERWAVDLPLPAASPVELR